MTGLITPHFSLHEVACHDGTPYPEEWIETRLKPLLAAAEWIRDRCGFPLAISSGYRTEAYNRSINDGKGGAKLSQHVQGRALDLVPVRGSLVSLQVAAWAARSQGFISGIGYYRDFVHIDTRPGGNATWYGTRANTENTAP